MRKLWIRWIALVLGVIVLGAVFIRLGEWQLHRLDQKRERNAVAISHEKQPIKPWQEVMAKPIAENDQWQRVSITGTLDAKNQLEVRYRNVDKKQGSEWVLPIITKDGKRVLVNRGFTEKQGGVVSKPSAPPPGEVTLTGYVRRSEHGKDNATKPVHGSVRLINVPAISTHLGQPMPDGYIQLIESKPDSAQGMLLIGPPELDEGPHLSYAIQWFLFTVIAAGGCLLLIRADLRDRRKRRERAARKILDLELARAAAEDHDGSEEA